MFQYFFGESLKYKYKYHNVKYMNSLLPPNQIKIWDIFENKFEIIHRDEIKNINFLLKINKFIFVNFLKLLIRLNLNKKFSLFSDKDFEIISKIPFFDDMDYLFYGYWQNTKFFKKNFYEIKKTLKFKKKLNIRSLHSKISSSNSIVGVHVRGGDYLKQKNKKVFSDVTSNYYYNNINFLNNEIDNTIFIFFSDDENYLNLLLPEINVNHLFIHDINKNRNDDFQYLSLCDHFIIPNSTFSLWAAYLSNNINKKIIMPDNWFNKNYTSISETKNYFEKI